MYKLLFLTVFLAIVAGSASAQQSERIFSVPDINGRATLLVKPSLPGDVMMEVDGKTITLKVVVDTDGNAVSATCSLTCPASVKRPAEAAAMASKFGPLVINGAAVKYDGILSYSFATQGVDWLRFGTAMYSVYIFDNLSLGPVEAMLTNEFAEEKAKLQGLDRNVDFKTRISTMEDVIRSLKGKLKPADAWFFSLGMAMRKLTAPFQSDRGVIREELQTALLDLGKFSESAPAGVERSTIDAVKAIAGYKIDPEMSNMDLNRELHKMSMKIYSPRGR